MIARRRPTDPGVAKNSDNVDSLVALLTATARGDEGAFAELYALTSPKLYPLLLRILRTREWAEDALQECYVKIWQNAERYTPERGSPMAWLATIARYRAIEMLRARRPEIADSDLLAAGDEERIEAQHEDLAQRPDDHAEESQGMARLDDCMDGLPAEHRDIILMAYYQGFTHSEISRRTGNPMGTIKTWLRRGLLKLRDCLGAA